MSERYQKSENYLQRALKSIPLGSQTFSKSKLAFPYGSSPFFIEKGQGCYAWDMDGNKYIDFVSSLLSVSLGYQDKEVDEAVKKQLSNGISFSLPHRLEAEVAELLIELIPCAEMVRFGKNGSDATSAAIRLARAYTGKDHVAVCGYHGWQDWYIGSTTRDLGVPQSTKAMTHSFEYNNISSLNDIFKENPNQISAVILEPMNLFYPKDNFLQEIRQLCDDNQALLIFDEMITGFRYHLGGAQQLFKVTPDLAAFGKGIANGFPLSAVVGKKEIMKEMENIFFSSTFGGETLSLAAAKACIYKMIQVDFPNHVHNLGQRLTTGLERLSNNNMLTLLGHPSWKFALIKQQEGYSDIQVQTLFIQEMHKRGILLNGGHNLNYSHDETHIDELIHCYDEVLFIINKSVKDQNLLENLNCDILQPIFKVR